MVQLDHLLVQTDDEWLSNGQGPLSIYIWETFKDKLLRNFSNISIKKKEKYTCADCFTFAKKSNRINTHWIHNRRIQNYI